MVFHLGGGGAVRGHTELTFTHCKGCRKMWGQERDPGGGQARGGGVGRAVVAGVPEGSSEVLGGS